MATNMDIVNFFIEERTPEETRALYNSWAPTYDKDMLSLSYKGPEQLASFIKNTINLPSAAPIIDVGCGTGLLGVRLKDAGYTRLDGIDISEDMMKEAKKKSYYDNHFLDKIVADTEPDTGGRKYVCVAMCGSLLPGHISPNALKSLCSLADPSLESYIVWITPLISTLGIKSKEFKESSFNKLVQQLCVANDFKIAHHVSVDDYRAHTMGEIYALKRTPTK